MNRLEDFLRNPEFIRWVKDPDPELDSYWEKWIQANPDRKTELDSARKVILGLRFDIILPAKGLKQALLERILADSAGGKAGREMPGNFARILRAAAMLATVALCLVLWRYTFNNQGSDTRKEEPSIIMLSRKANPGVRLQLKLPDGSTVWLNGGSEISYPESFGSGPRIVRLRGEAFFDVYPQSSAPFEVHASELITTALGTSFNIDNYQDKKVSVTLISGKVEVENRLNNGSNSLVPGQQLVYENESQRTLIHEAGNLDVAAWTKGILQFRNADFEEVRFKLENWFGIRIYNKGNPERKWNLSMRFSNESFETVLDRIAYIQDFNYKIHDRYAIIEF